MLVALLVVAVAPGSAPGEPVGRIPPRLAERVQAAGSVRVIARLAVTGSTPEGRPEAIEEAHRRARIAAVRAAVRGRLGGGWHRVIREYDAIPFLALEVGPDALQALAAMPDVVERLEEDRLDRPMLTESVPLVQADQAWAQGFDGSGVVVAILDTGVDATHPSLAGKIIGEACFSSNSMADSATSLCPGGGTTSTDPGSGISCETAGCDHGTHVAGIVAGAGPSFPGVARGAGILAIQVFSRIDDAVACEGMPPCVLAFVSDQLAALNHVYALRGAFNLAAANLSLGGGTFSRPCDDDVRKLAIDRLRDAGIATVVAAGNDGAPDALETPACISSAVSVGSTTKADVVWPDSNSASFLTLLAPGARIVSSVPGGGFAVKSGTSMATAHVSGAFAILKQAAPGATVTDILATLRASGLPITDRRNGVTVPRIRIAAALDRVLRVMRVSAIVSDFYEALLARPADPVGLAQWTAFLDANCDARGLALLGRSFVESPEFRATRGLTLHDLVAVLYLAYLGREPDPAGLAFWADVVRRERIGLVLGGVVPSPEFQAQLPAASDRAGATALVTRFYTELLGRAPASAELAAWVDFLLATGDVGSTAATFVGSAEFEARPLTVRGVVTAWYRAFLGRDPEAGALAFWEPLVLAPLVQAIEGGFVPAAEVQERLRATCGG
jgi:subtilisin family serine protease